MVTVMVMVVVMVMVNGGDGPANTSCCYPRVAGRSEGPFFRLNLRDDVGDVGQSAPVDLSHHANVVKSWNEMKLYGEWVQLFKEKGNEKKTLQIEKDGVRVQAPAGLQMSAAAAADGHSWAQHTQAAHYAAHSFRWPSHTSSESDGQHTLVLA